MPVITYLPKPVQASIGVPPKGNRVDCTSNCRLYIICLSNAGAAKDCLAWDEGTTGVVLGSVSLAIQLGQILWNIFANRSGETTEENDGVYKGKHEKPSLVHSCLGANPTKSDTNDRVYFSSPSECFGVARQSWVAQIDGPNTNIDYYSVAALAEGEKYQLVTNNTRQGAFAYAKNEGGGTWSTWTWWFVATCSKNC
jgi:hypothetical protein